MFAKYKSFYKILLILSISSLLLPSFGSFQTAGPPQSFSDFKTGFKIFEFIPRTLNKIGQEGKNIWDFHVYPFLHKIWQKIDSIFGKEIEQRKPIIKEEFKKETEELKQEAPELGKSFWGKIKDFFKFK